MCIEVAGNFVHSLLFADDPLIMANDEKDIRHTLRKLIETYKKVGLKVKIEKTIYLVMGKNVEDFQIENCRSMV